MFKEKLKDFLRPIKNYLDTNKINRYDKITFLKGYCPNVVNATQEQLGSHLLLHSHALEKSMSRSKFEINRGKTVLIKLRRALDEYEKKNFNKDYFAFKYACSAVFEYVELYKKNNADLAFLENILGEKWISIKKPKKQLAGFLQINREEKENNNKKSFDKIITNRYSIREFDDSPIDVDKIKGAIKLAQKTPSVCNRQAGNVYVVTNKSKIKNATSGQILCDYNLTFVIMIKHDGLTFNKIWTI